MRKIYQAPNMRVVTVEYESIIAGSGQQGDIENVRIDNSTEISSGSDFGAKGNYVQWDNWE